jgi:signal transduction histidine kinase
VDVNELINDIIDSQKLRFEKNNIDLDLRPEPDLLTTPMDLFQMERAFLNIVINSIDAMPDGGCLQIKTRNSSFITSNGERACVLIEFADTGPGMPPDQLNHIFDPFFSTKEHGTGLGLSLTKSIIEAHGGQINIKPGPGKGIIVKVRLYQIAVNKIKEESNEIIQDSIS